MEYDLPSKCPFNNNQICELINCPCNYTKLCNIIVENIKKEDIKNEEKSISEQVIETLTEWFK